MWYKHYLKLYKALYDFDLKNKTDGLDTKERAAYKDVRAALCRHWAFAADEDFQDALTYEPIEGFTDGWTLETLKKSRERYLQNLRPASPLTQ